MGKYSFPRSFTSLPNSPPQRERGGRRSNVTRGAFHLTGIFGNFGENSNGTVHPGGMFSEKRKKYLSRYSFFSLLPVYYYIWRKMTTHWWQVFLVARQLVTDEIRLCPTKYLENILNQHHNHPTSIAVILL